MLGSIYRSIHRSLVDAEKLLTLLNESTDVNDKPGAPDLLITDGEIEFGRHCCSSLPLINSMHLQKMSSLRTMGANLPYTEYLSVFLKEHQ
jgi:ABC-type transport system involved in Fe-S cluster assembly fused permease/ATPase subunit